MFLPYSVTVTPQNAAGCGFSISIDCFTQEGGKSAITPSSITSPSPPSTVPTMSPTNVGVIRSEEDPSEIVVTWQPLTLLEAKGFIEYLVQIHKVGSIKRQLLSMTVPMDEDSVTFSDLDTTADYEVSVGTITVSSGDTGPGELVLFVLAVCHTCCVLQCLILCQYLQCLILCQCCQ